MTATGRRPRPYPAVTDVQRVTISFGDRVIVHLDRDVTEKTADEVKERVSRSLGVLARHVLVLGPGPRVTVVNR